MTHRPEDLAATLLRRAHGRRQYGERRLSRARSAAEEELRACLAEGTVRRAWLIGSAVWGGAHARSDVDIVVEGASAQVTGALWDRLSEACGLDVDLLRYEELEPRFRDRVTAEGVEVYGT